MQDIKININTIQAIIKSPELISEAVNLRDHINDLKYIDDTHKHITDIADFFYNHNLGPEYLYKNAYMLYRMIKSERPDFWTYVERDAYTIDQQIDMGSVQDLWDDYDERRKEAQELINNNPEALYA